MIETTKVVEESLALLRAWPGYAPFSAVLEKFADVHAYLTGGVIRDRAREHRQPPRDFDIFLAGPSVDQAVHSLEKWGEVRKTPFGSPRWFPAETPAQYCDLVSISRFTNGLGSCGDIVDALRQFDFTGNALAIDVRTGEFLDPVGGLHDMRNGVMRMVVEYPDEPIAAGMTISRATVLWFRLLHYAAALQLQMDPATREWLLQHRAHQDHLASFTALFFSPHPDYLRILSHDFPA
ncbi:MAG: hypothetical protein ACKVP0_24755 [Pirellulaceae bacterium]